MTILERIRGPRRPVEIRRIARNIISRDVHALGRDAADVLDQVNDIRVAAVDAIEQFQSIAAQAGEKAGDAVTQLGDGASRTAKDLSKVKDLRIETIKLDGSGDDLVGRLKDALPTERITSLVENLERELPTTDKGRYDRAYSRGWARARTSFVVVGALTGILAGIAGAYLFDPRHGSRRRDMITSRVRRTTKDASRQAARAARLTTDRARGFATERGLIKPGNGDSSTPASPAALIGVMDPGSTGGDNGHATRTEGVSMDGGAEPVMPFADGPITDSSSTEREPMAAPEGGYLGGVPTATGAETLPGDGGAEAAPMASGDIDEPVLSANANAVTSTLEPTAEDATITGEESDRGTWHRTL